MAQTSSTAERVLAAVELIPWGRVMTYGEVAELVGTSARRVGAVLKDHGVGVPWWRVTSAAGELPPGLLAEAREHWDAEGIAWARSGRGCQLTEHRIDPEALGAAYAEWERLHDQPDGPDRQ